MNGEQTRDAMVIALRRDLLGPLADPSGCYPGATPKLIVRGQSFDRPSEARTLFVADDGEEVLAADTPTSRYIVGALYPVLLRAEEERQLDAQQAAAAGEADPEDAPEVAPRPPEKADLGEVEADEPTYRRTGRAAIIVRCFVRHHRPGRDTAAAGHRRTVRAVPLRRRRRTANRLAPHPGRGEFDIPLSADPGAKQAGRRSVRAAEVGARRVRAPGPRRPAHHHLLPGQPDRPGPTLAERVLFAARLAVTLPAGSLAPYPDRDPDRSPEAASLRLLYAAAPVRAVGHGVDATTECTADGDVVATEALPVAKVRATTPNVADDAGPLEVDMEELARWEPAAPPWTG